MAFEHGATFFLAKAIESKGFEVVLFWRKDHGASANLYKAEDWTHLMHQKDQRDFR